MLSDDDRIPPTAREVVVDGTPDKEWDHSFAFSMSGKCAHCARPKAEHVEFLPSVPEGTCPVNHLTVAPLVVCPRCKDAIEPRMITGDGPNGSKWKRGRSFDGRGTLTERDEERITAYVGWRRFLAENGGGEHA